MSGTSDEEEVAQDVPRLSRKNSNVSDSRRKSPPVSPMCKRKPVAHAE